MTRLEHPLAIYIFSNDKDEVNHILNNTNSGGVTINDCMLHAAVDGAPFGGVGGAGHGYYHGEHGVRAFTHLRTVVGLPTWMDKLMSFRYPPYDLRNLRKLGVPAKPPLKRGETLESQRVTGGSFRFWKMIFLSTVAFSVLGLVIRQQFLVAL